MPTDLAGGRAELVLPSAPDSPRAARAFARERLEAAGISQSTIDTVVLLTSELVTNALLHAGSGMRVSLDLRGGCVRVEVDDDNEVRPSVRPYAIDAPTGRGLSLVDAAASRWGCESTPTGKSVWFEIGSVAAANDGLRVRNDATAPAATPPGAVLVRIVGLPVSVYLETQAHNDALLREFALIAGSHGEDAIPHRLLELIREVTERFGGESAASRRQIEAAVARRADEVDLELFVPRAVGPFAQSLTDLLDEADAFCEAGDLLTLAASQSVRRFRAWYLGEVLRQLDGHAPQPWNY